MHKWQTNGINGNISGHLKPIKFVLFNSWDKIVYIYIICEFINCCIIIRILIRFLWLNGVQLLMQILTTF